MTAIPEPAVLTRREKLMTIIAITSRARKGALKTANQMARDLYLDWYGSVEDEPHAWYEMPELD